MAKLSSCALKVTGGHCSVTARLASLEGLEARVRQILVGLELIPACHAGGYITSV